MPSLSNDSLRQENMQQFLDAMHIPAEGIHISSMEGLYCFSSQDADQANGFTLELQKAIQGKEQPVAIKELSLSEILADELVKATCADELDRDVCKSVLKQLKKTQVNIFYSQDSGELIIRFPKPSYVKLFQELKYPNLKYTDHVTATLDIKPLLTNCPEKIIRIENINPHQAPIIFLNSSALQKKIFYAVETLTDGNLEVQPFFFVPASTTPANYCFALDTSTSMNASITALKDSVFNLAQQLFALQPNAKIEITTFSEYIEELGTFNSSQLHWLKQKLATLKANGNTPLYRTTQTLLDKMLSSNAHNNTLVFTDGEDSVDEYSHGKSASAIRSQIATIEQDPNRVAKNKFTVFNYNTSEDPLMTQVAETFHCTVVDTNSADFMKALKDPQVMKDWAAQRSLFKQTVTVNTVSETYELEIDHCGQLKKLNPIVCKNGDKIGINIENGDAEKILESSLTLDKPVLAEPELAIGEALNRHGFLAAPNLGDKPEQLSITPSM